LLGEPQDASADTFSLGGVVYFTLAGAPPFGESDPKVILARMLSGELDVSAFDPPIGEWLRRAMAPSQADRFADAAEMQRAWRDAVRTVLDRGTGVPWWRRFFSGEYDAIEAR